ncbi:cell morphogenesis Las1 protein [Rutstroemia sp. NJR-2017a WRK4]|nr:cell morphogenesis Las1 protein [Rutstroemia sp. NJR-2017a WRK4]
MDAGYMTSAYGANMMGYDNVEMLLEDVSRQMVQSSQPRYRLSMSNGQRAMAPMRVSKPSSTSNSPRSSALLSRRKTVMSDSPYRRRMPAVDQPMMASNTWNSNEHFQMPVKPHRPVSWHPSTQLTPDQIYQAGQPSGYPFQQEFPNFNASTPAIYSGYASPASSFSPMSMPFNETDQSYPFATTSYPFAQTYTPDHTSMDDPMMSMQTSSMDNNQDPTMYSHFDWNHFAANGFEDATAPPTPDNFLPIQHPEPSFTSEESIPYHPLSEDEPEGEELIGMGLYDTPDNSKTSLADPQLDNYRIMSQLLGSTYRRTESVGKGLKLEETWQPPTAKEDEDDDEEEDGEAEEEEEDEEESVPETTTQPTSVPVADVTSFASGPTQNFANLNAATYGVTGWI